MEVMQRSHLIETGSCSISVEERLHCNDGYFWQRSDPKLEAEAMEELSEFLRKSGLKDIVIKDQHNACFLRDESSLKISVFDFDADLFL